MTPRQTTIEQRPEKRDHRQEVTDSIIKMLEDGVAPWQKPWAGAGMPLNPTTDRAYRAGNAIHLMATGMSRGYEDPRWMTYKQAADNGWQVRKGEKGTHIEFWEVKDRSQDKEAGNDQNPSDAAAEKNGRRMIHRVYTVFNAKQIDGVPALAREDRTPFEAVQSGERILANSGARIAHDQRDSAFYNQASDSIHLPPKDAFKDAPGYYGTALHELAHWTGHPSRLDRSTLMGSYRFGDLNYAKEELRAELASVFIAAEVGVPHDPANHAAYVGSWIKALKEDKNEIFRAAHDASTATDFVLGLEREASRAEALEVANSQTLLAAESPEQGINAEVWNAAREEAIREEITALQSDRELVTENASLDVERSDGQPQRESSQVVSRYESDTGTVAVHDKLHATVSHTPVESAQVGNGMAGADSHQFSRGDLDDSLAAAKNMTAQILGDSARIYAAQTQSGTYKGKIIAETDQHLIQRLSPQTAIAHAKQLLDPAPQVGQNVAIAYVNESGRVKEIQDRAKTRELVR